VYGIKAALLRKDQWVMAGSAPRQPFLLSNFLDHDAFKTVVQDICKSLAYRVEGVTADKCIPDKIVCDNVVGQDHLDKGKDKQTYTGVRERFKQAVDSCILSAEADAIAPDEPAVQAYEMDGSANDSDEMDAGIVHEAPEEPMSTKMVVFLIMRDCIHWGMEIIPLSEEIQNLSPSAQAHSGFVSHHRISQRSSQAAHQASWQYHAARHKRQNCS
jgi:hypothetical protein